MAVTTGVVQVAASTSSGNQNITGSFGGETPDAVWVEVTPATTNNTAVDDAIISIGASDGTRQRVIISTDESGQASTDGSQGMRNDAIILLWLAGGNTVDGQASFSSFIANGMTINWSNPPAGAYLIEATFLFGLTNQYVASFQPGTTVNGTVSVTAPSFTPDFGWFAATDSPINASSTGRNQLTYGCAVNDGAETQRCIAFYQNDGLGTSAVNGRFSTNRIALSLRGTDWQSELTSWDANGFTSTLRTASAGTAEVMYLVADVGSLGVWLGTHDTPTSAPANQSSTAPGFTPQLVKFGMSFLSSVDTTVTTGDAGSLGCYTFTADDEFAWSTAIEDGVSTTNSQSLVDNNLSLPKDDGTAGHVATFVSMDANGWTLNFSTTDGTARKYWAFALEEDAGNVGTETFDVVLGDTESGIATGAASETFDTVLGAAFSAQSSVGGSVSFGVGLGVSFSTGREPEAPSGPFPGVGENFFTAPPDTPAPVSKTPGTEEQNASLPADTAAPTQLTPPGSPTAGERSFTAP